jgi:hypothetical protein
VAHNEAGELSSSAVLKVSPSKRRGRKGSKESQKSPGPETVGKTMELTLEGTSALMFSMQKGLIIMI